MKKFLMDGLKYYGTNRWMIIQNFALLGLFFNLITSFVCYFINEPAYMLSGIIFVGIFTCIFFAVDRKGTKEMEKRVMEV